MEMNHIMIDIETLGVNPGAAILSIAAARFDIKTGSIWERFYINIDVKSSLDSGLSIEADTFLWWLNQSLEARKKLQLDTTTLRHALISLNAFISSDSIVWGNSARFDLGLLSAAYEKVDMNIPWSHRNERCLRTIVALNPDIRNAEEFTGTPHNAMDDVEHQIKYLVKTLNSLSLEV